MQTHTSGSNIRHNTIICNAHTHADEEAQLLPVRAVSEVFTVMRSSHSHHIIYVQR